MLQLGITSGMILLFLLLAGRGLRDGYSYWSDEIFSVAASHGSWAELFRNWLIPDTHPPLYQSLLKLWMAFAGSGETATRSLSFLMAALTLVAAALFSSGRGAGRRIATLSFLGASPSFSYYAQEARSYATSMALATLMLGSALMLRQVVLQNDPGNLADRQKQWLRWCFITSCLLLSLTHYFSMLFALVVIAIATAEGLVIRRWSTALLLVLTMLIWPTVHLLLSSLSQKFERLDWIQVRPIIGTVREFIAGTIPLLHPNQGLSSLLGLMGIVVFACFAVGSAANLRRLLLDPPGRLSADTDETRFLLLVIACFVALMVMIDLVKPISQARYYSVVVPAVAYLFGDAWGLMREQSRFRQSAMAALLALVIALQLILATNDLGMKHTPKMNYKAMASFVERSGVCHKGCWSMGWSVLALTSTYFQPGELKDFETRQELVTTPLTRPLLGFHIAAFDLPPIAAANPALVCWESPGAVPMSVFILLSRESAARPERHGLRPCRP